MQALKIIALLFFMAAFPPSVPNLLFVVPPLKRIYTQVGLQSRMVLNRIIADQNLITSFGLTFCNTTSKNHNKKD